MTSKCQLCNLKLAEQGLTLTFADNTARDNAQRIIQGNMGNDFTFQPVITEQGAALNMTLTEAKLAEISKYAVGQKT